MDKKTIAVVVTYNRKELLFECLTALKQQNVENLSILVVDNASTDNTHEHILNLIDNKKIFYFNTGSNLGGAGGFNFGMRKAVEMGCDYVWVMDDDCIVRQNSLQALLNFASSINDEFGFLSSVVKWKDGSVCKMNVQKTSLSKRVENFEFDQEIKLASFVSLFIKAKTICELGLPIKDFFIWGDDWEYTNRISKKYSSYLVANSVVTHKSNSNVGVDISQDSSSRLDRYFYAYRNERYFYRKSGFKGKLYQFLKVCLHIKRILFSKCKNKKSKLNIMFKGLKAGKKFNPPIEYVYTEQHPLKVLEFSAEPFNYAGQGAFILNMFRNFCQKNIKYTLCTPFETSYQDLIDLAKSRNVEILTFNKEHESKKRKKYVTDCAKHVLKNNNFDVVHVHSGSIFSLLSVAKIAKKAGAKKVIVHSHNTGTKSLKYKLIKFVSDRQICKYADVFLACSDEAAKWKFPKKIIKNKNYTVIKNGINTAAYVFNQKTRDDYRHQFNLGSELTLCHVGRFAEQKNHEFIVKIAKSLKEKNVEFKCILVGDGPLKNHILNCIAAQNLTNNFVFLEKRDDVAKILMAGDIFVFPSIFEGLGIVAIEAQASGLLTLCSSEIPPEAFLTNLAERLNLNSVDEWVEKIVNFKPVLNRQNYANLVAETGYDAKLSATVLEKIYLK